ncbi:YIP1 family protein [Yoonia sp. MH D7]
MSELVTSFWAAILVTLKDPALMAQRIMQRRYTRGTLWMGLALVSILSVILVQLLYFITPIAMPLGFTPNIYGLVMACVLVILTFGIYLTGQVLGGKATFPHCFATVIWLEAVALVLRVVQALVYLFSPVLSSYISIIGLVALVWIMVNFVNEVHQFNSLPRALATIVMAVVGIGFGFGLFMTLIGFSAGMGQ